MILSVGTTTKLRLNLLTQEKPGIENSPVKRLSGLPHLVGGVAAKDTIAKFVLLRMLLVTSAVREDIFKVFVAALPSRQRKYTSFKKTKGRKRGTKTYSLEKFWPQGVVGLPNSGLMAEILALNWILVPQLQLLATRKKQTLKQTETNPTRPWKYSNPSHRHVPCKPHIPPEKDH